MFWLGMAVGAALMWLFMFIWRLPLYNVKRMASYRDRKRTAADERQQIYDFLHYDGTVGVVNRTKISKGDVG